MNRLLFSLKTCQKSGTKFLKIFFTHVPTSWGHVKNLGPNSWTYFAPMYPLVEDISEICPSSAKSICYFSVCHWVVSQGSGCSGHSAYLSISQHTGRTREGRGAEPPAPPLFFLYAEICWDMLSGLSCLSLGWLLNGKQKNSIYSWQRTGIYFWLWHVLS